MIVINVVQGRGKSGHAQTGKTRFLCRDNDELATLRQIAHKSLLTVDRGNWPDGQSEDQIVSSIVSKALDMCCVSGKVSDVTDVNLPGGFKVRLLGERASGRLVII